MDSCCSYLQITPTLCVAGAHDTYDKMKMREGGKTKTFNLFLEKLLMETK